MVMANFHCNKQWLRNGSFYYCILVLRLNTILVFQYWASTRLRLQTFKIRKRISSRYPDSPKLVLYNYSKGYKSLLLLKLSGANSIIQMVFITSHGTIEFMNVSRTSSLQCSPLCSTFWRTQIEGWIYRTKLNGMLRHSFLRLGEDIVLQHILLPPLSLSLCLVTLSCLLALPT